MANVFPNGDLDAILNLEASGVLSIRWNRREKTQFDAKIFIVLWTCCEFQE